MPRPFPAHYGRRFPGAGEFRPPDDLLAALAGRMLEPGDSPEGTSSIPAGYTYLGQFITHDLSFDGLPPGGGPVAPESVENLRTPRLDLDSLYGDGPDYQPFLYKDDGARMRVGWSDLAPGEDLPRTVPESGEARRALIHDPRNDNNLIISQLHLAFIKFHNRVADVIQKEDRLSGRELFPAASQSVRRHYQWMVVHDFLPMIVSERVVQEMTSGTGKRIFDPGEPPFIPVEFSAAAFRFGHSMVRSDYMLEPWYSFPFLSTDRRQQDLRGGRERPAGTLITDWSYFFGPEAQLARKIGASVAKALGEIPGRGPGAPPSSIPFLDLHKGSRLGLPTGQAVATTAMGLPEDQRLGPEDFPELTSNEAPPELAQFADNTPLWYYCLKEAERFGEGSALGPVGSRIVAEVLVDLLLADPSSYLSADPGWLPESRFGARQKTEDGRTSVEFGMRELLAFAAS